MWALFGTFAAFFCLHFFAVSAFLGGILRQFRCLFLCCFLRSFEPPAIGIYPAIRRAGSCLLESVLEKRTAFQCDDSRARKDSLSQYYNLYIKFIPTVILCAYRVKKLPVSYFSCSFLGSDRISLVGWRAPSCRTVRQLSRRKAGHVKGCEPGSLTPQPLRN